MPFYRNEVSNGSTASLSLPSVKSGQASEPASDAPSLQKNAKEAPVKPENGMTKSQFGKSNEKVLDSHASSNMLSQQDLQILADRFMLLEYRLANLTSRKAMKIEDLKLKLDHANLKTRRLEEELFALADEHSRRLAKMNQKARALQQNVTEQSATIEKLEVNITQCRQVRDDAIRDLAATSEKLQETDRLIQLSLMPKEAEEDKDEEASSGSSENEVAVVQDMKNKLSEEEARRRALKARMTARSAGAVPPTTPKHAPASTSLKPPPPGPSPPNHSEQSPAPTTERSKVETRNAASNTLKPPPPSLGKPSQGLAAENEKAKPQPDPSKEKPAPVTPRSVQIVAPGDSKPAAVQPNSSQDDDNDDLADDMPYANLDFVEQKQNAFADAPLWRRTARSLTGMMF